MSFPLSSKNEVPPVRGYQHDDSSSAIPVPIERERVRSLPILVEHQDGWHLDWIEVVESCAWPHRPLIAHARNDLAGVSQ